MSVETTNKPLIEIHWPNGSVDASHKFVDLFDRLMNVQWHSYPDRKSFKYALARRAKLWSGTKVNVDDTNSKDFFFELARAGMVKIFADGEDVTPAYSPEMQAIYDAWLAEDAKQQEALDVPPANVVEFRPRRKKSVAEKA